MEMLKGGLEPTGTFILCQVKQGPQTTASTRRRRRRGNGLVLPMAGQARGSQRGAPGEGEDTPARAELGPIPQPPLPGISLVPPMHPPRLFFTPEVKSWDGQEAGGGKSAVGWRQRGRGEASKGPELCAEPGGRGLYGVCCPQGLCPKHWTSYKTYTGTSLILRALVLAYSPVSQGVSSQTQGSRSPVLEACRPLTRHRQAAIDVSSHLQVLPLTHGQK